MKKKEIYKAFRRAVKKTKGLPKNLNFLKSLSSNKKNHFETSEEITEALILKIQKKSIQRLHADPEFIQMSAMEKLLSYYFVWGEEIEDRFPECIYLKKYFIKRGTAGPHLHPSLENLLEEIVDQGLQEGSFQNRLFISKYYAKILIAQQEDLLRFYWMNKGNEEALTAYTEKSVHLLHQLLQENFLDQMADLMQFEIKQQLGHLKFWS